MAKARPRVLVVNTSPDVMEALQEVVQQWGYRCDLAEVRSLRFGQVTVDELLGETAPDLVIFDLAPPMDENFKALQQLEQHARGRELPLVVTTTNAEAARPLLAGRQTVELLLKPFDLGLLHKLVDVACGRTHDEQLWEAWFAGKHGRGDCGQ